MIFMRRKLFLTCLVVMTALSGGMPTANSATPTAVRKAEPVIFNPGADQYRLYHRVWEIIRDTFYEPTYNNQNWSRWEHRYDGKLKTMDDSKKAIETMLASLGDRYTRYLDKSAFEEENNAIAARLYGIGIQMGMDKTQRIVVIAPIEGTPAARAGLMPADEIAEVNGKSTKGSSVEEVSKQIRGPIDTQVTLTINRNKEKKMFTITRAEIPVKSVQTVEMLNNDIGYVRLSTFISQVANAEMREALAKLTPARGIILDLRDNPGGLVTNAIDISSMFLEGGPVVSTVDRNNHKVQSMSNGRPITRQPLVVLINQGSASASEITSGALRDHNRADLVGSKSFGKGLVQAINRLFDGSGVNVTIARYLTPNNTDINKKGIVPDQELKLEIKDYKEGRGPWWMDPEGPTVKRSPKDGKDVQLKKAIEVLEKKIQGVASPYEIKLDLPAGGLGGGI
jgi:carboxyl-terminal processing protease